MEKENKRQRAVLVLGMHRSGTSAVAGALASCGIDFGKRLMPPEPGVNDKGFWEHIDIVQIHNDLLMQLDSSWDDVRMLPDAWERSGECEQAMERLREVICRDFSDASIWGMKDPRLCRLLPLWIELLERLRIDAFYVVVLRHPGEVMRSLMKRDRFSAEKALHLYKLHLLDAEQWTRGKRRCFLDYADFLHHPENQIEWVLNQLGLHIEEQNRLEVHGIVDANLRHHRFNEENDFDQIDGYRKVVELYETLKTTEQRQAVLSEVEQIRQACCFPYSVLLKVYQEHIEEVYKRLREQTEYALSLREAKSATDEYNEGLRLTLEEKERYNESLRKALEEKEGYAESLKKELERKHQQWEEESGRLREAKSAADEYNESLRLTLEEKERYNESLRKALEEKEGYAESLKKELERKHQQWEEESGRLREAKSAADEYNESLRCTLDKKQSYNESLQQLLDEKHEEISILTGRNSLLEKELNELKQQILVRWSAAINSLLR